MVTIRSRHSRAAAGTSHAATAVTANRAASTRNVTAAAPGQDAPGPTMAKSSVHTPADDATRAALRALVDGIR